MVYDKMKYSVLNFKSLNTEKMMNIKPITIFCGVNSSGKSSIIQSMLLLSQSILYARETLRYLPRPYNIRRYRRYRELKEKESKEKKPKVLIFEGDKCHLQGFRNVIFENDISNNLTFKWSYNLDDERN